MIHYPYLDTPEKVKNDENYLCGMEIKEIDFNVYLLYRGGQNLGYIVFLEDEKLFEGIDYKPAPAYEIDSMEAVISLLGFLTVQPGDTDDRYFMDYTAAQMKWANSPGCGQLSGEISDFENTDSEYHKEANKFFKKAFHTL